MKKFFLSAGIGLVSGVITFFLSVAFLCFVLLALRAASHSTPDMTLAYRAALPVAILGRNLRIYHRADPRGPSAGGPLACSTNLHSSNV